MGTGREYNEQTKLKARNNAENIAKDENTKRKLCETEAVITN